MKLPGNAHHHPATTAPRRAIVPLINEIPAPRDLLTQLGLARFGGEETEKAATLRRPAR